MGRFRSQKSLVKQTIKKRPIKRSPTLGREKNHPPTLAFFFSIFLPFQFLISLFCAFSNSFPKDFRGSAKRKTLAFLLGSPCFSKKQGLEGQGNRHKEIWRDTSKLKFRWSRGAISFVLWKCPVSPADILTNLSGACLTPLVLTPW